MSTTRSVHLMCLICGLLPLISACGGIDTDLNLESHRQTIEPVGGLGLPTDLPPLLFYKRRMIVVESSIYSSISSEVAQLKSDWQSENVAVEALQFSGTAAQLRDILQARYAMYGTWFEGAVLVGNVPTVLFQYQTNTGVSHFPTDHYYRDLDGSWVDDKQNAPSPPGLAPQNLVAGSDGFFDDFIDGTGDRGPEIAIGRITVVSSFGNTVSLVKLYLNKVHQYRQSGSTNTSSKALMYLAEFPDFINGTYEVEYLEHAYSNVDTISPDTGTPSTSAFLNAVSQGYEWITIWAHGTNSQQNFGNGWVNWPIIGGSIDIKGDFFAINSCSVGEFATLDLTTKQIKFVNEYIGGRYIFDDPVNGLVVLTRTKGGAMFDEVETFYKHVAYGYSVGAAAVVRLDRSIAGITSDVSLRNEISEVVFGDPFLKPSHVDSEITDLSVSALNVYPVNQIVVMTNGVQVSVRNGVRPVNKWFRVRLYNVTRSGDTLLKTWYVYSMMANEVQALPAVTLDPKVSGLVKVVVDDGDRILELDEDNNARTASLL